MPLPCPLPFQPDKLLLILHRQVHCYLFLQLPLEHLSPLTRGWFNLLSGNAPRSPGLASVIVMNLAATLGTMWQALGDVALGLITTHRGADEETGPESWSDLPKVTQPVSSPNGVTRRAWSRGCLSRPSSSPLAPSPSRGQMGRLSPLDGSAAGVQTGTVSALPGGTRGNPRWQSLGPFQEPVRLRSQARAGIAAHGS